MLEALAVAAGGAVGSLGRWGIGRATDWGKLGVLHREENHILRAFMMQK